MTDRPLIAQHRECDGKALVLTLNNPPRNPLSEAVMDALDTSLRKAREDKGIRCVVLASSGMEYFSVGANIKEWPQIAAEGRTLEMIRNRHALIESMFHFPKPIVAALNGTAIGGSAELAVACHFRIMASTASLWWKEMDLGLFPAWGGTSILPRLVGRPRALDALVRARPIAAAEALEWGLATAIFEAAEFKAKTMEFAEHLASLPPRAVRSVLKVVSDGVLLPLANSTAMEREEVERLYASKDVVEGVSAFIQKRKAVFTGE
ncbi:MAG: enoyl-CoA hydratase/isomerase family protein [Nitrospirae bacterium]|nr:enoyl-CoA hydratase/isomerase family protein [Nitrospirota bacterium]